MHFTCYSTFDQLPAGADALFAAARKHSLFLSRTWFETLIRHGGVTHKPLLLACVADGDSLLALLPLVQGSQGSASALRHRYTPLYSLLTGPDEGDRVAQCLARGLWELPLQSLQLEPLGCEDGAMQRLESAMQAVGFRCERHFRFFNWVHQVANQSFTTYMAGRPGSLRNTIARKRRKLEREHEVRIELYTGSEVARAMRDYDTAYRASWKANEQYTELLHAMATGFARSGNTRLAVLYVDGQPAAGQLWFVAERKASIFRLAYDQAWKAYSPGSILTHYLMQRVFGDDQVVEVDFLNGNEPYKQDWMTTRRERYALSCVRPAPVAGDRPSIADRLRARVFGVKR